MRRSPIVTSLLLLLHAAVFVGCSDSDSPTEARPPSRSLNGTFVGSLPVQPPGEDWSEVTMALVTEKDVSGVLRPKVGIVHSVGGTYAGANLILRIGDLPGTSACHEISMSVFRFDRDAANQVVAFEGTLSGRCQGTVSGGFRMVKQ